MQTLKLDLKPRLKNVIITSVRGVSGSAPGMGAMTRMAGERKSLLFRGKGLEFEKFREFSPDDDATMIDWKASLRAHKMLVKSYSEEQNKDIILCFDVSSTMTYGSGKKLKAEYAAEIIANLAFNIVEAGDNASLLMFSDKIKGFIPPLGGIGQYHKIVKFLTNPKNYEGKFDMIKALGFINSLVKREAIVIFLSDFIGLSGDWKRALEAISGRLEIIGIMVRDPLDDKLPETSGQIVISDPFTEEEHLIDPARIAEEYEQINKQKIREINVFFKKIQADLLMLHTDQDFVKPVRKFFMG